MPRGIVLRGTLVPTPPPFDHCANFPERRGDNRTAPERLSVFWRRRPENAGRNNVRRWGEPGERRRCRVLRFPPPARPRSPCAPPRGGRLRVWDTFSPTSYEPPCAPPLAPLAPAAPSAIVRAKKGETPLFLLPLLVCGGSFYFEIRPRRFPQPDACRSTFGLEPFTGGMLHTL